MPLCHDLRDWLQDRMTRWSVLIGWSYFESRWLDSRLNVYFQAWLLSSSVYFRLSLCTAVSVPGLAFCTAVTCFRLSLLYSSYLFQVKLVCNITVSLQYLPTCLCSTVTCRIPIQWFKINSDCTPKKHIPTIKTQKACVTNKNIWVCLFELKRQSNTDLIIVPLPTFLLQGKYYVWTQLNDLSVAQNVFIRW